MRPISDMFLCDMVNEQSMSKFRTIVGDQSIERIYRHDVANVIIEGL